MLVETHENAEIRKYLLGDIQAEDKRRKIEERLMLDDDYFEEIEMQEDELIQDYVDDQLDTDERQRFEKHFLISEERWNKVKFARALRRYINEHQFIKNSVLKSPRTNFRKLLFLR